MPTLDLIYVTTGRHPELERLICEATDSIYSHAAIGIAIEGEYKIIEATREGVKIKDAGLYDSCEIKQIISLPISDDQRRAVALKAVAMAGMQYGKDDCIISAIHDLATKINKDFAEQATALADQLLDNEQTIQCSGLQVELIRAAFPDFAGDCPGNHFTPEQARQYAIEYATKLGVAV